MGVMGERRAEREGNGERKNIVSEDPSPHNSANLSSKTGLKNAKKGRL